MGSYLLQALINGVWRSEALRAVVVRRHAAVAGLVSAVLTFVITAAVAGVA